MFVCPTFILLVFVKTIYIYIYIYIYIQCCLQDESNSQRYLRWADAYMIVYSITDRSSFEVAREYLQRVSEYLRNTGKDNPIALVGNKCDLERYRYTYTQSSLGANFSLCIHRYYVYQRDSATFIYILVKFKFKFKLFLIKQHVHMVK